MTLAFLDVDLSMGEGAGLLAAVRQTDPRLAGAASLLRQAFLIRSPWAPALRFVGALATSRGATFSVGGAGLSIEGALMSCLGEAAERLSQLEQPGDLLSPAALRDDMISPAVTRLCGLVSPQHKIAELDWVLGNDLRDRPSAIAADWCLRRTSDGPMRLPGTMLSTGCAAGRDERDASARALLELIERDAAALWWAGAHDPSSIEMDGETSRLLLTLRGDDSGRLTWLLDISTDLKVPVVVALSCDKNRRNLAVGFGARVDARSARHKAVLELCQMEIGLQLARLKPEAQRMDDDRRHLARAEMELVDARFRGKERPRQPESNSDGRDALDTVVEAFVTHGIEATLVDLTRPDIGVSVVKAVAPDLQPMPGSIQTARLKQHLRDRSDVRVPDVPLH